MALDAKNWRQYLKQLADRLDMSESGSKVTVASGDARALRDCARFLDELGDKPEPIGKEITIKCSCSREQCTNEMRVSPVRIEGRKSIMLSISRPHEWGTMGVRTVCLNRTDRDELRRILADLDWWGV